jgi:hypothetical protein
VTESFSPQPNTSPPGQRRSTTLSERELRQIRRLLSVDQVRQLQDDWYQPSESPSVERQRMISPPFSAQCHRSAQSVPHIGDSRRDYMVNIGDYQRVPSFMGRSYYPQHLLPQPEHKVDNLQLPYGGSSSPQHFVPQSASSQSGFVSTNSMEMTSFNPSNQIYVSPTQSVQQPVWQKYRRYLSQPQSSTDQLTKWDDKL